jgi:hypothetical protein
MPKFTLAFWENRVRQDLAGEDRSSIKKIAKLAKRRFEVFTNEPSDDEMLEFYSTITYADPTPYLAFRHINSENAARRLGLA